MECERKKEVYFPNVPKEFLYVICVVTQLYARSFFAEKEEGGDARKGNNVGSCQA